MFRRSDLVTTVGEHVHFDIPPYLIRLPIAIEGARFRAQAQTNKLVPGRQMRYGRLKAPRNAQSFKQPARRISLVLYLTIHTPSPLSSYNTPSSRTNPNLPPHSPHTTLLPPTLIHSHAHNIRAYPQPHQITRNHTSKNRERYPSK